MQNRAKKVGASLDIRSDVGGGTAIVVRLVHCITCFQSELDPIRASTEHFVAGVVLWKQMIQCTSVLDDKFISLIE
jgi:hypothetical protein